MNRTEEFFVVNISAASAQVDAPQGHLAARTCAPPFPGAISTPAALVSSAEREDSGPSAAAAPFGVRPPAVLSGAGQAPAGR